MSDPMSSIHRKLDEIHGDLKAYSKQTAMNTVDILWLKRIATAVSSFGTLAYGYLFRKFN